MVGPPQNAPRAYDASAKDGVLTVAVRKEFDFGNLHQDWAHAIATMFPGPFTEVRVDLSACGLVSSTFFAGLIQLHHTYAVPHQRQLRLVKPDPRLLRNLIMLKLDKLFTIEPR